MAATDKRHQQMTTQPVERLICRLAVPSIVIMLISALYNMADTYFVGSLGTSATAAVGVAFSLMAVIQAIGFFFGHGAGNFIARALGKQDNENAAKMAATGFFSALIAGVVVTILGLIFLTPLARLLGATDTILPYALDYMRYILIAAPFMASSLMLNNLLRFQGNAFFAMVGMVSGAVLNVGLDPLFIFVFKLGVSGAALATMLSQMLSCTLLFIACMRGNNVRISMKNFSPSRVAYKEILRGGAPSLLRQSLASIAAICLNQAAGQFGDSVIAAMSIVNRVTMFAGSALLGFGQGFQPVCGFNYGAGLYDRVKKAFWFCVKVSTLVLVGLSILGYIMAPHIISAFRSDDMQVIEVGTRALRLQCFTFPLVGWVIMSNMMLQTIGKSIEASILSSARQGLFMIPLLLLLVPLLGIPGIQLTTPIADACTFILAVPLTIRVLRKMGAEHTEVKRLIEDGKGL